VLTPLGIDIGTTRIRVAMAKRGRGGQFGLTAVASKEISAAAEPDVIASVLLELIAQLRPPSRACVLSLSPPAGLVRVMRLASMRPSQRRRAARAAAESFAPWNPQEVASVVRLHEMDAAEGLVAVGIARQDVLAARIAGARKAGLRVAGVDHDACALRRAYPLADGVLDVGHRRSTLHAFLPSGPMSALVPAGGADVTRAIAEDLRIDDAAAEKRKRIFGTAGAGESAKAKLVDAIRLELERMPERRMLKRLALVGNGSRLAGLGHALESATQITVEVPASDLLRNGGYPEDVARAAAPDWTLAASLATWAPC
jgi:Tfp pilus assembly PilM family ATPase